MAIKLGRVWAAFDQPLDLEGKPHHLDMDVQKWFARARPIRMVPEAPPSNSVSVTNQINRSPIDA